MMGALTKPFGFNDAKYIRFASDLWSNKKKFTMQNINEYFHLLNTSIDPRTIRPFDFINNTSNILRIKNFLENAYYRPIHLEKLADIYQLDRYYLARGFKNNFAVPPRKYLFFLRLEHFLWDFVRKPVRSLINHSMDAGYGDYSTFSKRMHRLLGYAPSLLKTEVIDCI